MTGDVPGDFEREGKVLAIGDDARHDAESEGAVRVESLDPAKKRLTA